MARKSNYLLSAITAIAFLSACSSSPIASTSVPAQENQPTVIQPSPSTTPIATQSPQIDYLGQAINKATRADRMAKEATSKDDWTLVANQYQQSIDLLKKVQQSDADYAKAQANLKKYQPLFASAKAKLSRPTEIVAVAPRPVQSAQSAAQAAQPKAHSMAMTAQQFLEDVYFHEVVNEGYSGGTKWCAEYEILETSFFSPRSYEILSMSENGQGASAIVRIESSNRGGQPVINNWSIYLKKGATTTERDYREQKSPVSAQAWRNSIGGWCVSMINEN